MNPLPNTTPRRVVRLLLVMTFAALLQSCEKQGLTASAISTPVITPTPYPGPVNVTTMPFNEFMTTWIAPPTNTNTVIQLLPELTGGTTIDNFEMGFAFRSSAAGTVTSLGTWLPFTGFPHQVTIWDSATQTILATATVTGTSTSAFTYSNVSSTVSIKANHGYVVGFNTLPIGSPVDQFSEGSAYEDIEGFMVDRGASPYKPMLPFNEGDITVENTFVYNYGAGAVPANLFPKPVSWNTNFNLILGAVDIIFTTRLD